MRRSRFEVEWSRRNVGYWNDLAERYDSFYRSEWSRRENRLVATILAGRVPSATDAVVVDIGCGSGLGATLVPESSVRYIGVDISWRSLLRVRSTDQTVPVVCADAGSFIPFADSSVHVVMCIFTTFSYLANWKLALGEFNRILRPGGSVYISTLNRTSLRRILRLRFGRVERYRTRGSNTEEGHAPAWTFRRREMRAALERAGFGNIRHHPIGLLGGVMEAPAMWGVDRNLLRLAPGLAHMSDWSATKAAP